MRDCNANWERANLESEASPIHETLGFLVCTEYFQHSSAFFRTPMLERQGQLNVFLLVPLILVSHDQPAILGSPGVGDGACSQPQMARHQGDWARTTARVLSHLREKSRIGERTVTDQAAIDKVWAFVGVRIDEYDRSGQWAKVPPERREGVRQRLHDGFLDDAAFLPDGHAARKRFMRADLLKWGERLLAAEAVEARPTADPTTAGLTSQPTAEPTAAPLPGPTSPSTTEPTPEPSVAGPTAEPMTDLADAVARAAADDAAAKAKADAAALYSFRVPFNSDTAAEAAAAILPPEPPRAADNSDTMMTSAPEETGLLVAGLERLSTRSRSDRCDRSASDFRWADHDSDVSFWSGSSALPQIGEVPDALYDAATGQAPINFTSSRNVSENLSWESPIRHSGGGGGG